MVQRGEVIPLVPSLRKTHEVQPSIDEDIFDKMPLAHERADVLKTVVGGGAGELCSSGVVSRRGQAHRDARVSVVQASKIHTELIHIVADVARSQQAGWLTLRTEC